MKAIYLLIAGLMLLAAVSSVSAAGTAKLYRSISDDIVGKGVPVQEKIIAEHVANKAEIGKFSGTAINADKYDIDIKNITYEDETGTVKINLVASRNGKSLAVYNPVRIYNPPYTVGIPGTEHEVIKIAPDGSVDSSIAQDIKEDPKEALKQTIISILEQCKEGHPSFNGPDPTSVFYPTYDGYVGRGLVTETWATIWSNSNGNTYTYTDTDYYTARIISSSTSDRWNTIYRGQYHFNTASLPDNCNISEVIFKTTAKSKSNTFSSSSDIGVTAMNGSYGGYYPYWKDYPNITTTELSNRISYASYNGTDGANNNFTFTSTGISYINKTGYTFFQTRFGWDIDNSPPAWQNAEIRIRTYLKPTATVEYRPYLYITYSVPPVSDFSANDTDILAGQTVAFTDLSTNSPTSWTWSFDDGGGISLR